MGQNNELQERSPSDDSQQGYQFPNAVTSNTDRQLNGQNDEQQERSPPVMMVSKGTSRQMLLHPIQTHSSINNELQERSPSDDSQQGYQSPNAVTSNTDRQLNGQNDEQQERSPPVMMVSKGTSRQMLLHPIQTHSSINNELQERSPSDDSQQGYQSPNAVTSNTDRQLNGQNDEQQERSPPVMMVSKGTSRQMLLYPIQTHSSINDEMQEGSPSDDSQQGYQSPNAVTSNTDRQLRL
ncbi:hypothetical protein MAR_022793, partial [Mya arenaria]